MCSGWHFSCSVSKALPVGKLVKGSVNISVFELPLKQKLNILVILAVLTNKPSCSRWRKYPENLGNGLGVGQGTSGFLHMRGREQVAPRHLTCVLVKVHKIYSLGKFLIQSNAINSSLHTSHWLFFFLFHMTKIYTLWSLTSHFLYSFQPN